VLLAELQHRTRNLLAVVQAIARQTMRSGGSLAEFAVEYESRLRALGRVQALLARTDQAPMELRELIEIEVGAHGNGDPGKVTIEGPQALVPAMSAQALALAMHELATNAVKYGALSQPTAKLEITWQIERGSPKSRARILWRESRVVMPETVPTRRGYGTELVERALPYQLGAKTKLEFGNEGLRCEITVDVEERLGECIAY
jgi:two-component sensor histidine kinase